MKNKEQKQFKNYSKVDDIELAKLKQNSVEKFLN